MKMAKHDTSLLVKSAEKATDLDDEAAEQLSSTNSNHIANAALEGHLKQHL